MRASLRPYSRQIFPVPSDEALSDMSRVQSLNCCMTSESRAAAMKAAPSWTGIPMKSLGMWLAPSGQAPKMPHQAAPGLFHGFGPGSRFESQDPQHLADLTEHMPVVAV